MRTVRHRALCLGVALVLHTSPALAAPVTGAAEDASGTSPARSGNLSVRPGDGHIALTFDDGPHPVWTMPLLDLLDRHGVRATFFVVGEAVAAYPEIVREMTRRGHSVQNHTWSHPLLTRLSDAAVARQFEATNRVIQHHTGRAPVCMRPPYMDTNTRIRSVAAGAGLTEILWDIDPQEWLTRSARTTVDRVLAKAASGEVILLHDASGQVVLPALDTIIPALRERGLEFERICDDPPIEAHYPRKITPAGEMR